MVLLLDGREQRYPPRVGGVNGRLRDEPTYPSRLDVTPIPYDPRVASVTKQAAASAASAASAAYLGELSGIVQSLLRVVRAAAPGRVSGDEARAVVALFAEAERAATSGVALFTPVVVATGSFTKEGHGSAAEWLGALEGSSTGAARGRLAAAERAARTPVLTEALHGGDLSCAQLEVVTKTSAEVAHAATTLLPLAQGGASHQELSDTAARLVAGSRRREHERARRARVHAHRHLRAHQVDSGGVRGEFFCDEVQWARVSPRLEAEAKKRWKAAGAKDGETLEAHRLDAFIDLLAASNGTGPGQGAGVETLVVIDAAALRRGTTQGDEICEIEGIGPISVAAATELLGQGGLRYLVKEGFDIKTVTKATRDIAKCIDAALIVRDRTCCTPHCAKRLGLERDHVHDDYAAGGPTELDNVVRLCPAHHALKTHSGWRIEGQPGEWKWIAPDHPKNAGAISRARKLAAAKAKATKDRNKPRRT